MLIDSHIHVGQFNDLYFAPSTIHELVEQLEIDFYAVSSTTQCEENYPKVVSEFEELIRLDKNKVLPVMWITPEALKGNIAWYLESDIKWRMLKIHPFLNQTEWQPSCSLLEEVLDIVRELDIPLLIHTGTELCCHSGIYESVIRKNTDITFILAHGRPLQQALYLARTYSNTYVDSAFMPVYEMKSFIDEGLSNKLIWGTDMCIPQYFFPEKNMTDYYKSKLNAFRSICTQNQFEQVTFGNALKLFNINTLDYGILHI